MTPGQHSGGRQRLATSIVACLGIAGLLATALMIQATPALAQGPASAPANAVGQAKVVVRFVYGTVAATRESLKVEDSVYWQELIETGEASAGKMVFLDGTTLSTGPNARVRIDEFVYAGNNQAERVVVSIGRGVARFVTGGSPSSAYSIRTPNAIIGVRGTDFTVLVDDQGGTSVRVNSGQVVMTTADAAPVIVSAGESYSLGAPGTVVPMQGAVPEPSPMKPAPAPVSAPASDPVVGATPPPRPAANQEPLPAEQLEAATAEIEAMLMIEGEGDRAAMNSDAELLQLSGRKGLAASSRAVTPASQAGPNCSGC